MSLAGIIVIMLQKPNLTTWVIRLLDPFLTVDPKIRKRLDQNDLESVKKAFWFQVIVWPLIYIAHFHFNDQAKQPLRLYFLYRYGMALTILILGAVGYYFRQNSLAIRACLTLLATLLCFVQSWSMTLGPYISHAYLIWLPLIVLASFSRSFVLQSSWLVFLVCTSRIFWEKHTELRFVFSDTVIGLFILLSVHLVRRVWIDSCALAFQNEDLRKEAFVAQQTFDKHLRSFISPVLIKNIELMTVRGATFIAALDSTLKLRKCTVAVLFSDMRNFSVRSDDITFLEKELIPSARAIIDPAEENGGIAKQVGDAVFIYYSLDDPEESLLRSLKDGIRCSLEEQLRVRCLGRTSVERFFTLTFGMAFVGNMVSARHREATIIGSPANLAARIDAMTKDQSILNLINNEAGILLEQSAYVVVKSFSSDWQLRWADLSQLGLSIRSYPDQTKLYFLPANEYNINILNQLLVLNSIPILKISGEING